MKRSSFLLTLNILLKMGLKVKEYDSKQTKRSYYPLGTSFSIFSPLGHLLKVKGKQSPGTDAIRTKVLRSKPKWERTKATNRQNKENTRLTE